MTTELANFTYCQETINLKKDVEKNYLVLCARLHKIKNERLYEPYFDNWGLFLDELKINKRVADAMCRIYQEFIVRLGIDPELVASAGGWGVAEELLPLTTSKEEAEEALQFASGALRKDIRLYVKEKKNGGVQTPLCTHEDTYVVEVCRGCSERWEVHEAK